MLTISYFFSSKIIRIIINTIHRLTIAPKRLINKLHKAIPQNFFSINWPKFNWTRATIQTRPSNESTLQPKMKTRKNRSILISNNLDIMKGNSKICPLYPPNSFNSISLKSAKILLEVLIKQKILANKAIRIQLIPRPQNRPHLALKTNQLFILLIINPNKS